MNEYHQVVDLALSDEPTFVPGKVGIHEFHLDFRSWDRGGKTVIGWVFNMEYDGRYFDLHDAPHGRGRNEISSYSWKEGHEEDFSSNHLTGERYPFTCVVKLLDISRKNQKGEFIETKVLVRITSQ